MVSLGALTMEASYIKIWIRSLKQRSLKRRSLKQRSLDSKIIYKYFNNYILYNREKTFDEIEDLEEFDYLVPQEGVPYDDSEVTPLNTLAFSDDLSTYDEDVKKKVEGTSTDKICIKAYDSET